MERNMVETSTGSKTVDELYGMINMVMNPDDDVSKKVRDTMRATLKLFRDTRIMSTLGNLQELAWAMSYSKRKTRLYKSRDHHSFTDQSVYLSLSCVSDRAQVLVSVSNQGIADLGDMAYFTLGCFEPNSDDMFYRQPYKEMSVPASMGAAQLDWYTCLSHKAVSWLSLELEGVLGNQPEDLTIWDKSKVALPLFLMSLNSNKFSQASEAIRYIVVNTLGMSSPPTDLYNKMTWYTPKTVAEKAYMFRMIKLGAFASSIKAFDLRGKMLVKTESTVSDGVHLDQRHTFHNWNVAFPHEKKAVLSDQHFYNSFYVCRNITMQRHSQLVSEALVLKKQIGNHEKFWAIRQECRAHEGRFRVISICCPYSIIERSPQCLCYCEVTDGCRNPCCCEKDCQCPCCAVSALDCPEQRKLRASAKKSLLAYVKTTQVSSSPSGRATDGRRLSVTQEQWDLLLPKAP
jgi:hypothetical protein